MTTPAPVRFCTLCKQADDHPRHDIWGTDPNVAPHMDCCASNGCPDGSCDLVTRSKGDKKGNEFREQITAAAFVRKTEELKEELPLTRTQFSFADLDQNIHGSVQGATDLRGADR